MTVPGKETPANSVPAAAVIRRGLALFGITGRKAYVGGSESRGEIPRLNLGTASKTLGLEFERGEWNSKCRGEIRRYLEEHQWRRRLTGSILTLRYESVGSKQD